MNDVLHIEIRADAPSVPTGGPYTRAVIIEVRDGPVSAPHRLLRACDGAAVVVASAPVATLLGRGGHRGPIVATMDEARAVAAEWDHHQRPTIAGHYLSTAGGTRRRTVLEGEPWSLTEVERRLDAAIPIVPSSWDGYVEAHRTRFVHTLAMVPPAPAGGRALDASAFPLSIHLLDQLGYWVAGTLFAEDRDALVREATGFWVDAKMRAEVWYDAERHRMPVDDEMFDVVLAGEIIEHMPADPVQLLVEFNRVLRVGGRLILTTPNIISRHSVAQALHGRHPFNYPLFDRHGSLDRHHQEFTPDMVAAMVRRSGFVIDRLTTADVWFPDDPEVTDLIEHHGYSTALRGDSLFVSARKVSALVDRTPPGIYTGDEPSWDLSHRVTPRRAGAGRS